MIKGKPKREQARALWTDVIDFLARRDLERQQADPIEWAKTMARRRAELAAKRARPQELRP